MGASDILGSGNVDIDGARADRNNRVNPPEFQPGQQDGFSDDIFSGGINQSTSDSLFSDFGTSPSTPAGAFDSSLLGSPFGGGMNTQPQQQPMSDEDKIFEAGAKGAKVCFNFFKDIATSVKEVTPRFWASYGRSVMFTGAGVSFGGILIMLFGLKSLGVNLLVSGLVSSGLGVILLMSNIEKGKECSSYYKDDNTMMPQDNTSDLQFDGSMQGNDFSPDLAFEGGDMSFVEGDFESDDDDPYDDPYDNEDGDLFDSSAFETHQEPEKGMDMNEALNSLPDIPKGMYTRQYLYDMFVKVLPTLKPDYNTVVSIDEDDDTFIVWEEHLRDAASITGVKEDNLELLQLISLEENLFTIKLRCNRVTGFKSELVAKEISNIYAYSKGEFNPSVYAKFDNIGTDCVITVFTGETAMISLKDMYNNCKDFMLNSDNYMPVVLGIDPSGKVICYDFKKLESVLITGMPRSGKSWFVQAVLTQMCALVPPSELNIYICDPKDGISDFKAFCLPHVKKFVSGDDNIVNTLRKVVKEEAPRRKKIIGDAGYVNIWDYKERNPDVHLPVIYVLIDEVVTLAERMEKETKSEFQGLLVELISQLPALGIRAFLIPHVVKDSIIAKTATDLIPCRISVCGDAGHIEACTGTKPRDFVYKLSNKGDMAVRMPAVSTSTLFVHGPALTSSNPENNDLFDYLRKVWSKLEPEEVANSVAKGRESVEENENLLKSLDDNEDFDLFDDTEESNSGDSLTQSVFSNPNEKGFSGLSENMVSRISDDFGDDY